MVSRRTFLGAGTAAVGLAVLPVGSATGDQVPWQRLARHLRGELVLPSDPAYATAKQLELAQFDVVCPGAIAYCASSADVSVAVRFAADHRLPVAVRSGGHSYGGYSTTPGLIIDVFRLNEVTIGSGTVAIGPGAQNVQILNALAPHGLVVSEGGCPTVAAGGFIQGGGFGFLTRSLGMACDAVTSAEVVLADGRIVTASPAEHEDLFWAIRGGGGGNFGVVTRFAVTPHAGDLMATANLVFPHDRTVDVLDGVAHWAVDAPRTIGGGAFIVAPDSVPTTVVTLASRGAPGELDTEIGRLTSMTGPPVARQDARLSYRDLMMTVFGCADLTQDQCQRSGKTPQGQLSRPSFSLERTRLATEPWPRSAWEQVVTAFDADPLPAQLRNLDLHLFGGAVGDLGRTETAFVHRDALFSVNYRVTIQDPAADSSGSRAVARRWVDGGFAVIDPFSNGETYQNWMDPALPDWRESYYAENYSRLTRIKSGYDPYRFFTFAQGIEPVSH
jgi:hypothetical protein